MATIFAVDIHVYDLTYALQGIQQLIVAVGLATICCFVLRSRPLKHEVRLWLCGLAAAWVIVSIGLYIYSLHNYVQYERPLYKQGNISKSGL
jgi:hypothetical protein